MAATVGIERRGLGIELHRGAFTVEMDGEEVGCIAEYGTGLLLSVEPGRHTLQIRTGRYSSRVLELEVFSGSSLNFRTHGAMVWPRYLASLLKPGWGINLHRA